MKRVSSIDVAKLAGVSQSSVSRVFSPNANVSDEKRERILKAARQLGYKPNVLARSLITQSTNLIGIVVADVASLFYAHFLSLLSSKLREMKKQVILFNVGLDQTADDVLSTLLEYRVDALIIAATTLSADMAAECARNGTPVILFNQTAELDQVSSICIDNEDGGRQVAEHLLANNHKRFAYIAGINSTQTNQLREKGYFDRLQAAGTEKESILREQGDYSYKSGFDAATRLLKLDPRPDAIFCAGDTMAFGAIDAARALGLSIPNDVSIVGFDNVPQADWNGYQLTTMAQPLEDLLASTLLVMTQRLEDSADFQSKVELFKGALKIRRSVRIADS